MATSTRQETTWERDMEGEGIRQIQVALEWRKWFQRPCERSAITIRSKRNLGEVNWGPNNLILLFQEEISQGSKASIDTCECRHCVCNTTLIFHAPLHCCLIYLPLFTVNFTSHHPSLLLVLSSCSILCHNTVASPTPLPEHDLIKITNALGKQWNCPQ